MPMLSRTAAWPKGALLRVLGVGFGIAVSLGNSIGSGIMRTPGQIKPGKGYLIDRQDLDLWIDRTKATL